MTPIFIDSSPAQARPPVRKPKQAKTSSATIPPAENIGRRNWLSGDVVNGMFSRITSFLPNWWTVNSMMVTGPKMDRTKWKSKFEGTQDLQIILPIHTGGNHWSLTHLDSETHSVHIVDSLRRTKNLQMAKKTVGNFIQQFLPESHQPSEGERVWDTWTASAPPCAQQPNTWDCGVYTIAAAFRSICDFKLETPLDTSTTRLWLKDATNPNPDLRLSDLVSQDLSHAEADITSRLLHKSKSSDLANFTQESGDPLITLQEEVKWIHQHKMCVATRKSARTALSIEADELGWVAEVNAHTVFDGLRDLVQKMEAKMRTLEEIDDWFTITGRSTR